MMKAKKLSGREWYHQRFDGAPFFLACVGDAEIKKEKRKPAGTEADVRVCFFKDGRADWYLDMTDIRRGSRVVLRLARRDPNISGKLLSRWRHDEQVFEKFFHKFLKINLSVLSDVALEKLYIKYHALAIKRFTSSSIIDHFALGTDEHVAKMLRQELGRLSKESDFTKIFSIATAPVHQSFINEAELKLLEIAIDAPTDEKRLENYRKKYFWIKNNYITAEILDVKYFKKEIKLWLKSGIDLRDKYESVKNTPIINARKKKELLRRYPFSRLLRTLLKISEDFTWWQDERKKATYLNIHIGTQIFKEISRRRKIDPVLLKYLIPSEVSGLFKNARPTVAELKKRLTDSAIVMSRSGDYALIGRDARKLHELMFLARERDIIKDFRGLSASLGRVTGRVKLINSATEVDKVQKGDILVAVMTRPDYIAGIKRAAAIVTNEGGITCHAAIISRELGIPCIIGTKIATEVLKDGDIVEVNANHGVVTIIK